MVLTINADSEGIRLVQQLRMGFHELQTDDQQIQTPEKCSAEESESRGHQQRSTEAWIPVRGTRHRLLLYAGCGPHHRSSH